jgi:UDP:flavonoid glycosyltransferase YjiC (YdhE family)
MSHFLLTWELGGALGHLAALRSLATPLLAGGHRVTLALRDQQRATEFFPELQSLAAPLCQRKPSEMISEPSTFADILSNAGWSEPAELSRLVSQWRKLFDVCRPDVVVCNFAPTPLLAAQGHAAKCAIFGTGFYSPPELWPLPDLCPWRNNYPDRLRMTEDRVCNVLNDQLRLQGVEPVEHITQLFRRANANLLATYPEMDHYPDRVNGDYVGPWGELPGLAPDWPEGEGPRVFAYLKPMESLSYLLSYVRERAWPTIVYAPGAEHVTAHFAAPTLRVVERPLEIRQVAATCDLAILNAGHNATLRVLLNGKPVLALPLSGEQHLVGENVERLGAGLNVLPNRPEASLAALERIASEDHFRCAAETFGNRYADVDERSIVAGTVARLERLGKVTSPL